MILTAATLTPQNQEPAQEEPAQEKTVAKKQQPSRPGNTGAWYIDVVESEGSAPTTTERLAGISASTTSPATTKEQEITPGPADTTELIGEMWEATGGQDALSDWAPEELSRTMSTRRNFRWPIVLTALVVGAVAWAALAWMPSITERRAAVRADAYQRALFDLRVLLPDAQLALLAATANDGPAFEGPLTKIGQLRSQAEIVADLGLEPLPRAMPFSSPTDIEALEPIRDRVGQIASETTQIVDRLGAILEYRNLTNTLFVLPQLPTEANGQTANELSVTLAAALADSVGVLESFPSDPLLAPHTEIVSQAVARFSG